MHPCPVCQQPMTQAFCAELLKKHTVDYFRCAQCGLLQTEQPYWLEEAYSDAVSATDTGIVLRNISVAAKLAVIIHGLFDSSKPYADGAGGYGMLVRLMRDFGFDFYWEDKYCQNVFAKGFEASRLESPVAGCSAIEVLEHVHDPLTFVRDVFDSHQCRTLIFTTELYTGDAAPAKDWWYYAFESGQHISFYQEQTLRRMADALAVNYHKVYGLHIFTDLPLSRLTLMKLVPGPLTVLPALWIRKRLGARTEADSDAVAKRL